MSQSPLTVDLLLLPRSNLILLSALCEPLRAANRVLGEPRFKTRLCSLDGQPVPTTAGFDVPVEKAFEPADAAPLLVAASYGVEQLLPIARHPLIRAGRHRPFIGSADGAVRLLAEAGLYNGYQTALHAEDVETLGEGCRDAVLSRRRWVVDRNRASARGSGSAMDMMLALVGLWVDRPLAEAVARLFDFVPADSLGPPRDTTRGLRDDRVARVLTAMGNHLADPLTVAQLATLAGLSTRGLSGLFERELGRPPKMVYVQLRLERARQLLIETDWPVARIAALCGYPQISSLTRAYAAQHGESPITTRKQAVATAIQP